MNLKKLRVVLAEKGLRQCDLAERSGLSQSYISYIIRGEKEVTEKQLRKIERALHLKKGALEGRVNGR